MSNPKNGEAQLNIKVPRETRRTIAVLAAKREATMAQIVNEAIDRYLEAEEELQASA